MPKLRENGGRYFITLPKEKVLLKGWKPGQMVDWSVDSDGNLILREVKE